MRSIERKTHIRLLGALAALSMLGAACGSDGADEAAAADTGAPDTGAPDTGVVADTTPADETAGDTDPAEGMRIVSLSPTATEMMFAIGAGDLLVAVDEYSNHPAEATELPNELSGFEPNVESIAAYEPDLVLTGGDFTGVGDSLAELGIETWDGPAALTVDDVYTQIEQLGAVTGHVGEAAELVSSMQTRIDEIVAGVPTSDTPLTYYHELDNTLYSVDSTTFVGALYSLLGLVNVADQAEGDNFGYPQLNAEFLVTADPDLIFLADTKCCAETAETVAARDGWDSIAAVRNGNVIEMDDDIASRWGPRIVDYLEAAAQAVAAAAVPA